MLETMTVGGQSARYYLKAFFLGFARPTPGAWHELDPSATLMKHFAGSSFAG